MKSIRSFRDIPFLALLAVFSLLASSAHAQSQAGKIEFVAGDVQIRNAAGQARAGGNGGDIFAGDTIETGQGRLHMRMIDSAYVSLQPQSVLRIDEYAMADRGNEERGVLALLRGGLRTITGLIGRVNRANYRLSTSTATIGIRGTEFAVTADDGTRVNVTEGIVALCTDGGCIDIGRGQSGFAADRLKKPSLSFISATLPPVAANSLPGFMAAEQRNADGVSSALFGAGAASAVPLVVPLPNGPGALTVTSVTAGGSFAGGFLGSTMTFAASGALAQGIDCCSPAGNYTAGVSSDFGADGIIAWGRWTSGVGQSGQALTTMNYVTALTANAVTVSSIVRGYVAFASTAPTVTSGGTLVATGAANSVTGSLTVNFGSIPGSGGSLTYLLNIPVAGQTFTINGSASQYNNTGFLGTTSTITSTGAGCATACVGVVPFANAFVGVFTGASAQRAGGNYGFSSQIGTVSGAVVFK